MSTSANALNAPDTQYQMIVGTGSGYQSIGTGSSGQVLTSNGASSYPTFQAGSGGSSALTLIGTQVASSSTTIDFTSIGSYNTYLFTYSNYLSTLNTVRTGLVCQVSVNGGSTWANTSYSGNALILPVTFSTTSVTALQGTGNVTTAFDLGAIPTSTDTFAGTFTFLNVNTSNNCQMYGTYSGIASSGTYTMYQAFAQYTGATGVNAFRFLPAPGTGNIISTGTLSLYGVSS